MLIFAATNHVSTMKRILLLLAAVILTSITQQAIAQQRKTNQRTVTTQKKTLPPATTTTKKPVVQKIAAYSKLQTYGMCTCVAKDAIYYVETQNKNNAVKRIDMKTGEVTTIIPGIEGIYEGARPVIYFVKVCGDKLLVALKKGGVLIWDGKSIETSKRIPDSEELRSCNDKYALISTVSQGKTFWALWDIDSFKPAATFANEDIWGNTVFIMDDGTVWNWDTDREMSNRGYAMTRITKDGKRTPFWLSSLPYISMSSEERGHSIGYDDSKLQLLGDYIYINTGRRVFRLNVTTEAPQWEEFAKVPPTQAGKIKQYCVTPKGDMIVCTGNYGDDSQQLWKAGDFEHPINLGRIIKTGFSQWNWDSFKFDGSPIVVDANGNFLSLGPSLIVWNPDGVVGYDSAKGKIVDASAF